MSLLLSATVKGSLLLLAALAATALLRRRSAAVRHWVLTAAVLCCMTVPALELLLPAWTVPLPAPWLSPPTSSSLRFSSAPGTAGRSALDAGVTDATPAAVGNRLVTTERVILSAWIAGLTVGLAVLVAGLLRIRRLASRSAPVRSGRWRTAADDMSRPAGIRRPIRLLLCAHPTMLVTWGTLKPTILLPACARDWSDARMRVVLHHELAHIGRGDWIITLAATVLRSVCWFNPLLWIACRQLRQESERACDDVVLSSGVSGADYAAHLVGVARESVGRRHSWSPAIAIARPSTLEGRVRAMLNARVNREPLSGPARAATLALVVAATVPIAVVSLSGNTMPPATGTDIVIASPAPLPARPATASAGQPAQPRAAATAAAQAVAGTIEGVLYDPFGGLLPGAAVTITHTGTGGRYDVATDPSGAFSFPALPSGDYELTTSLPGFSTVTNVVSVAASATVQRRITMPLGTLEEVIHVTCEGTSLSSAPRRNGASSPRQAPAVPNLFSGGIGGQIKAPHKVYHANPICPTGVPNNPAVVVLAGRVGIDGFLSDLREVGGASPPAFAASAMEAARLWEFTPTLLNGVPIEANITITVGYTWPN